VIVISEPAVHEDDYLRQNRSREKKFAFDRVFDKQTSQEEVFEEAAGRVVQYVLDGFNATVFAYGPTGSGKTFSKKKIDYTRLTY
jgi:kinesin family protein 18/19